MNDPTDTDATDRAREAEQLNVTEARRREAEDFKWLMAHAQGRRFMHRLLAHTGVYRSSYNHSGSLMSFNEGKRTVGLMLMSEIMELTPELYFKLLKEHQGNDN